MGFQGRLDPYVDKLTGTIATSQALHKNNSTPSPRRAGSEALSAAACPTFLTPRRLKRIGLRVDRAKTRQTLQHIQDLSDP
jgi:hypothetical protein